MIKKNVVILNPPSVITRSAKLVINHGIPPIGLAYIAGSLKKNNINFTLLDAMGEALNRYRPYYRDNSLLIRGLSFNQVINRLPENPYYFLIGNGYSIEWLFVSEFLQKLKTVYPNAKFIIGGENPTAYWDKILKYEDCIDVCVIGEGDDTVVELLRAFEAGDDLSNVEGIAYRDKSGNPVKNKRPNRIKDISNYFPDWDLFPLENYFKMRTAVRSYGKRTMPMIASRGCPYQCTFCNSPNKWGTTQVTRKPEEVIQEMKLYKEKYNINHICLVDLASTVNGKWFLDLCNKLIKEDLGLTWEMSSGTRSELLSFENLKVVKKSKNIHLSLSPESGSKKVLEMIKKGVDLEHFEQVVKDCARVGVRVKTNFITGLRSQTRDQINITYWMACKYAFLGADDIAIYTYVPFPGTEMFNRRVETGEIQINTREEYERFNYQLATYSIVATVKSHLENKYPVHIFNQIVMLICFIISIFRKPTTLLRFFWNLIMRKPIGVFEVATYSIIRWPFLLLRMRYQMLFENEEEKINLIKPLFNSNQQYSQSQNKKTITNGKYQF